MRTFIDIMDYTICLVRVFTGVDYLAWAIFNTVTPKPSYLFGLFVFNKIGFV